MRNLFFSQSFFYNALLFTACNIVVCTAEITKNNAAINSIQKSDSDTIVVFVHGTINIRKLMKNLLLFVNRRLDYKDAYYYETEEIRYTQEHHESFMTNIPGLVAINNTKHPQDTSELLVSLFNDNWKQVVHPSSKSQCHYFVYNWLGILSERTRQEAGDILYSSLHEIAQSYKKEGFSPPRFYVIGFSHGGNVALHMAQSAKKSTSDMPLSIHTLVLLGTPIHNQSMQNATSSFFETIYSISSPHDWIQPYDISSPGFLTNGSRLSKINRPVYEYSIFLKNKFQQLPYSHSELGHFCWYKNNGIKVPIIVFIPFLTESGLLLFSRQLHKCTINIADEKTQISTEGISLSMQNDHTYQTYLKEIKQFGIDYNLFPKSTLIQAINKR